MHPAPLHDIAKHLGVSQHFSGIHLYRLAMYWLQLLKDSAVMDTLTVEWVNHMTLMKSIFGLTDTVDELHASGLLTNPAKEIVIQNDLALFLTLKEKLLHEDLLDEDDRTPWDLNLYNLLHALEFAICVVRLHRAKFIGKDERTLYAPHQHYVMRHNKIYVLRSMGQCALALHEITVTDEEIDYSPEVAYSFTTYDLHEDDWGTAHDIYLLPRVVDSFQIDLTIPRFQPRTFTNNY